MSEGRFDRVSRVVAVVIVAGCALYGLLAPESLLFGGTAWLVALIAAFAGWGYVVGRIAAVEDPDLGLRVTWGIAAVLAVAGILLAAGVLSRPVLLAIVVAGLMAFAYRELSTKAPTWHAIRDAASTLRQRHAIALLFGVLALLVVYQVLGAVCRLDRNPWDDDLAYTPLIRRLLDAGDLVEPFSLRRMASYGGQTVLQGLAASRGTVANVHLIDGALGFALVVLLVVGHARRLGSVHPLWLALVLAVLVVLPDISINTASHWTGAAVFLALYRTVDLVDRKPRHILVAALLGAAICTLRNNFIPVVVLFLAISLWYRRREWWRVIAVAIAVLLPWCIAAYMSNETFLFPVFDGTWNHELSLRPSAATWVDDLAFITYACIESQPFVAIPVLALVVATCSDARRTRPLPALLIASVVGFLLLARSFSGSDGFSMWRYAFGFSLTLTSMLALEAMNAEEANPVIAPRLGRCLLIAAMGLQLFASRHVVVTRHVAIARSMKLALQQGGDPAAAADATRYASMQAVVPAGAPLLVMIDDPAFLDFSRNPIANLDTPGFASPTPGLPMFCGTEAWRRYLVDGGWRYVAFVRSQRSHHFFRRPFWVWRIFNDAELFQVMSVYTLDAIETLAALAQQTALLYDSDGLVVLDLAAPSPTARLPTELPCTGSQAQRRDLYLRELLKRERIAAAWSLTIRQDVVFGDGFSNVAFVNDTPRPPTPRADKYAVGDGTPARFMQRRARLRVRGDHDMQLGLRGRVRLEDPAVRPRLDISVAGHTLTSVAVDESGAFAIDVTVTADLLDDWTDVFVITSASGGPGKETREPRSARLEELTWQPRAP
jgi:hypothetical protein